MAPARAWLGGESPGRVMIHLEKCRAAVTLAAIALSASSHAARADSAGASQLEAKARAIHARVLVLDSHVDVLLPTTPARYAGVDGKSQADFDKLVRGGIGAVTFALAVGPGPREPAGYAEARTEVDAKVAAIGELILRHPDKLVLATRAADVERLHQQGK